MTLLRSVKSKLLLAFVAFLAVVTLLNAATAAYLTNRQGEAEAFNRLSQQLLQLQDDFQGERDALVGVAREAAGDEKNLSDLAILFSQELARTNDPDPIRDRALGLNKAVSLNRLRLILTSARLSSLAVYVNDGLSHFVTRDDRGLVTWRSSQPVIVVARDDGTPESRLDNWQYWAEHPVPVPVSLHVPAVEQVTARFEFPTEALLVLRVIVPIQAVTRLSFNETIAERPTIATKDLLRWPDADGTMPEIIGAFVFTRTFDHAFFDDIAARTGVLSSVLAPDGSYRVQASPTGISPELLKGSDDSRIRLHTSEHGGTTYYQALKLWKAEPDSGLVLGSALSRAGTVATIRQTILGVLGAALVILMVGTAVGYGLVSRMVTPIKALTAAATSMERGVRDAAGEAGEERALSGLLGGYLDKPIARKSDDEIGELTTAFNAMSRRLYELIASLSRSEAYLAEAQRLSRTGSFSWHTASRTILWSAEMFRIFGYDPSRTEATQEMLFARVHPDDRDRLRAAMARGAHDGMDVDFDHRLLMPDGQTKHVHVVARALRDGAGALEFVGAVMDVTEQRRLEADLRKENAERKRAEEILEDLAGRLIHAQEEERSRIGRELHDHVSQRLALLAIKLDQCHQKAVAAFGASLSPTFDDLRQETSQITEDVHRLSHRLHSSMLDHLGLVPALHRLVAEFSDRHQIAIDLTHATPLPPVSPDVALCLFRIAEEALNNVAKHSQATSVRVHVGAMPDLVGVTIEDAGVGFDATKLDHEAGLGLVSMRERLRLVHGTIQIESAPSKGTRVVAWAPTAPAVAATASARSSGPRTAV